jgi:NTE family protein
MRRGAVWNERSAYLKIKMKKEAKNKMSQSAKTKRALVLPGGGGRGAYQVGVAKALHEEGIDFDFALGTSIGGLNAAMIAQGDLRRLEELWCTIRAKDIFGLPSASHLSRLIFGNNFGVLDTSPLEELLKREVSLHKLKSSPTRVGLCTTDLCSLQTNFITTDDIVSNSELVDVLMATSALPLAFPPRNLHGSGLWVDGGLVRNTPLHAALEMGADEIYMVLLHPAKINVCPMNMFEVLARCLDIVLDASANKEIQTAELYNRLIAEGNRESEGRKLVSIKVFQPRRAVNTNLLEIDPARSRQLINQGYAEAMEQLHDYNLADPSRNQAIAS